MRAGVGSIVHAVLSLNPLVDTHTKKNIQSQDQQQNHDSHARACSLAYSVRVRHVGLNQVRFIHVHTPNSTPIRTLEDIAYAWHAELQLELNQTGSPSCNTHTHCVRALSMVEL